MSDDTERKWTQAELHAHARSIGIEPEPDEIIPQGVKYLAMHMDRATPDDIEWAKAEIAKMRDGEREIAREENETQGNS